MIHQLRPSIAMSGKSKAYADQYRQTVAPALPQKTSPERLRAFVQALEESSGGANFRATVALSKCCRPCALSKRQTRHVWVAPRGGRSCQ
jgi:hypothetical protein